MAFLFGRNRQKSNADLCRATKDLLTRLSADERPNPRVEEELAKNLAQMKITLQGTAGRLLVAHASLSYETSNLNIMPLQKPKSSLSKLTN